MERGKYEVPEGTKGDLIHTTAKAGLSLIPWVGGPIAELFSMMIQPPLEKRRQAWMEQVAMGLKRLEEHGLTLDSLQDNEEFVSAVLYASQVALRNHQQTKLEALRNAVLNVASGQAPDHALQLMFLNFVDTFSEWHVRVLKLFQNPPPLPGLGMGGLYLVLENAFPELKGRRDFYDQLWKDLYLRGLTSTESLHGTMTANGLSQKRTSPLGDLFLTFIS